MIYAFDSSYFTNHSQTAAVAFANWTDAEPAATYLASLPIKEEYISGEFYKRELPGILKVLEQIDLKAGDILVVDGYVHLNDKGKLGLGGHLYERLTPQIPVVGVAKKRFLSVNERLREVRRGESDRPLFVTAVGMELGEAAGAVLGMDGPYRLPTLLKLADRLCRQDEGL